MDIVVFRAEDLIGKDAEVLAKLKTLRTRACPICQTPWETHAWSLFFTDERHQAKAREWVNAKDRLLGRLEALVIKLDSSDSPGAVHEKDRVYLLRDLLKDIGSRTANEFQLLMNYQTAGLRTLFQLYYNSKPALFSVRNLYDIIAREMSADLENYKVLGLKDFSDHEALAERSYADVRKAAKEIESSLEGFKEQVEILSRESIGDKLERFAALRDQRRQEELARDKPTPSGQGAVATR